MNILKSMITCLPVRWQKPFNFSQFVQVQRLHTARRCMRNAGLLRCSTDRRKMYAALVRPVESSYRDTHTLKSLLHKSMYRNFLCACQRVMFSYLFSTSLASLVTCVIRSFRFRVDFSVI